MVFKLATPPVIEDSWNTTVSPSINLKLFLGRYLITEVSLISANTATAPLVCPTINSPMVISPVEALGPFNWVKDISGAPKLSSVKFTSDVSYIEWIWITSGTFKEIRSSWSLVPKGYCPYDNPSFIVVEPIPDDGFIDLSTTNVLTLFLIFFLAFIVDFLTVVISWQSSSLSPRPLIWSSLKFAENTNLLDESDSVVPSDLIREYLSSEYGR